MTHPIKIYIDRDVPYHLVHDLKMHDVVTAYPYCSVTAKSWDHLTAISNIFFAYGYEMIHCPEGHYVARKKEEYEQAYH